MYSLSVLRFSHAGPSGIVAEINQAIGAKGVVSNECKMVVHQYGDQIVEMLLAQMDRGKVCTSLGLCQVGADERRESGIASVVDKDVALSKGNDPGCQVCEMAVVWAQNQLRQNKTKEQIDAYLNQLCERLPSPNGESAVDCNSLSSMPKVAFTIAGSPSSSLQSSTFSKLGKEQRLSASVVSWDLMSLLQQDRCGFWEIFLWEFTTQFSIMEIIAWDLQRPLKDGPPCVEVCCYSLCERRRK